MPDAPALPLGQIWDDRDLTELRRRLIKFFAKQNLPAEDFADEVILRMLNKLSRLFSVGPTKKDQGYPALMRLYEKHSSGRDLAGDEECATDLLIYAYSIAKNVAREQWRLYQPEPLTEETNGLPKRARNAGSEAERVVHKTIFPEEADNLSGQCLQKCLRSLHKDGELLLKYYQTDKKKDSGYHRELADGLSMKLGTLHVAAYRARERIRECVVSCMERELPGSSRVWCKE
jgi:DNA-directed RNA polymerase specialized sigma24 family protein